MRRRKADHDVRERRMECLMGGRFGAKASPDTLRLRETWSYSHIMHEATPSWCYIEARGSRCLCIFNLS